MVRKIATTLLLVGATCAVLNLTFPLATEVRLGRYRFSHWLRVYLEMTVIETVIVVIVVFILSRVAFLKGQRIGAALAVWCGTVAVLWICAWLIGTMDAGALARIPLGDMQAKFFREYSFLSFSVGVAPLEGVLAALFYIANEPGIRSDSHWREFYMQ